MSIAVGINFEVVTCGECGIVYAMTTDHFNKLKREAERGRFYCPNGHCRHFIGQSHQDQLDSLRLQVQQRDNALSEERKKRERLERRIKKGVCLYCKRTFSNLADHMKCKHEKKP